MKKAKGITLIALIITIIVMLILVGVTVAVALNGGLFSTAKTASLDTRAETVREKAEEWKAIKEADKYTNDKKAQTLEELVNDLENQKMITPKEKETILTEGQVTIGTKTIIFETTDLSVLEKYCLGKIGPDVFDFNDYVFKNNDVIPNAENELELFDSKGNEQYLFLYVKYNEKVYNISVGMESGIYEKVELIYGPKGREGETALYDSNNDGIEEEWTILYDNGDNVEMVSKTVMGNLSLGSSDEQAQTPGDVDKDGTENTNIDKAIYSYNNAIERLNNYCESLITNPDKISVRSIGSNPDDPSSDDAPLHTSEILSNLAGGKYNGVGKSGTDETEKDNIRLSYYRCFATGGRAWIASRSVTEHEFDATPVLFGVFYTDSYYEASLFSGDLWGVQNSGALACSGLLSNGVRPVVKVLSDSVKIKE